MGTNFYINTTRKQHIGKRSAAGTYCWNCYRTLCRDGDNGIHTGKSDWYDKCPGCGAVYNSEPLTSSSVGVELGFTKHHSKHEGISTIASFTWAIKPSKLLGRQTAIIIDEYGNKYNYAQFCSMLSKMCPIEFYNCIGEEFS